ncbi:M24 family metallopeptidase [Arsukibacterium indicum]|uniref:M24 family metallopeptidase n=1 Tax=Arsukibacterium indicum TaxID=2848612 RepID=A0ABS6MLH9_9GAMM|nr:M24 family metallopeptidase [Arsukibacterium indicum]MBV2129214.1 M24 family metallopeptidase [Arsukibacterium indicum]
MKTLLLLPALATMLVSATISANTTQFSQGRQLSSASDYQVLPARQRVAIENRILNERLEQVLPTLMAESELDMWLVINREYAEDPVYFTLVPQPTFAARRTTMLLFNRLADGTIEKLSVNRYPLGEPYQSAWAGGNLTEQWQALAAEIVKRKPQKIGINTSEHWPVADGLTSGLHQQLVKALPADYQNRLVSAEQLVVRWLEQRTEAELELYPQIVSLARSVIAEAFSNKVITPGVTSTDDVAWYLRERFEQLDLPVWFMPYVNLQRQGLACEADNPFCGTSGVIQRGDVLHTDVGICYLKLCTDTQEMAYVLKNTETDAPAGLKAALATGNRWQDILTGEFKTGRSGNTILANTIKEAKRAGINSSTYTHAIGFVGHAPGPTIGMWDNQGPTPVQGDWPLYANTAYAIEGNIKQALPEWDQLVHVKLEQSAYFDGKRVIYLAGRQTQWHLIR